MRVRPRICSNPSRRSASRLVRSELTRSRSATRSRRAITSIATGLKFAVAPAPAALGTPEMPAGQRKKDEFFGEVETYRGEVRVKLPVLNAKAGDTVTLDATSQGCADIGVCYVPQEQKAQIVLAAAGAGGTSDAGQGLFSSPGSASARPPQGIYDDESAVARLFQGSFALLVLSFFGFGLLLSFTPCVLPMIPILSGIVVGQGQRMTRLHALMLSGAYVLGMAITYAAAGVLAGLSGAMFSAAFQNAWVLGTFAAVFVLLAGGMLGVYEICNYPRRCRAGSRKPAIECTVDGSRASSAWALCRR